MVYNIRLNLGRVCSRMARKRKSDGLPFTPAVFLWARTRAGLEVEEAAGRLKVSNTAGKRFKINGLFCESARGMR